ncbi:Casein kinase II subunit beta [Tritrichomonas foetus]|uniref:Casein kinase II subunit beta n=1 Tax=Tritrichomonas foetus TaxID=1144522 RepID=A0A1J4KJ11_9EUKA|nr:Casein kinase II subunit beta [Tritrichomonas foetus]|eukprot:OHT10928.1 Casein kinase II subunit beta [Tritrichomonas foetus]
MPKYFTFELTDFDPDTLPKGCRPPSDWLVEIDEYYLQSAVSYYGLNSKVPNYSRAAAIIKGRAIDTSEMSERQIVSLFESCKLLYGLLHQRYIVTEDGIRRLYSKYKRKVYGVCPRTACQGRALIPMGLDIEHGQNTVKCYCPQCHDIYNTYSQLDGAFFGPDLPIMFHKVCEIPTKFRPHSNFFGKYLDENGKEVPEIKQRLHRWGETRASSLV